MGQGIAKARRYRSGAGRIAACVASVLTLVAAPVAAQPAGWAGARGVAQASALRELDIMLMVTSLRCRHTGDDFQADFQRFEAAHMAELNAAAQALRLAAGHTGGPAEADRAADRMSVVMANRYGGGHPWMSCAELGAMTRDLAQMHGAANLLAVADYALSEQAPRLAIAP
ncbi:S-adenosyl-L-homocysteine hydrolase [Novosphingobium sp. FSY-8]|uniref:S-adenosyl-L-homocysteine hydrolase n=1 Tax=Novosphingobium ovatum TaxID=1908523 RepID=A0ABW9XA07_9SPHN|nr:S-adenosyl-L-homocysteine hydrolase [Novosphingobium ovatum]NBC35374.1 S-adenosyl-L-homocysteine hydrolase [Novosphingobium ovatum]